MREAALREIVFDTETTGLDPLKGDRLVCETYLGFPNAERSITEVPSLR